jgi:hypothetical protein
LYSIKNWEKNRRGTKPQRPMILVLQHTFMSSPRLEREKKAEKYFWSNNDWEIPMFGGKHSYIDRRSLTNTK